VLIQFKNVATRSTGHGEPGGMLPNATRFAVLACAGIVKLASSLAAVHQASGSVRSGPFVSVLRIAIFAAAVVWMLVVLPGGDAIESWNILAAAKQQATERVFMIASTISTAL
jgi:hypothetical protein